MKSSIQVEHDPNLIDLKSDGEDTIVPAVALHDDTEMKGEQEGTFDFQQLKLIEQPSISSDALPQTLEDCVGFLSEFPLQQPNADNCSVVDMVNILSMPEANNVIKAAMNLPSYGAEDVWMYECPGEYKTRQEQVYNTGESDPLVTLKKKSDNEICHVSAPLNFGHVVRPGCISFYYKFGLIYTAPEGKWWLPNVNAKWIKGFKNVSLDQDLIQTSDNQVIIIRVVEGQVGLITVQGIHRLLDVRMHVFNSGTVQFCEIIRYADNSDFSHGPYHYMNIPRGKYAKVWVEVLDDSTTSN